MGRKKLTTEKETYMQDLLDRWGGAWESNIYIYIFFWPKEEYFLGGFLFVCVEVLRPSQSSVVSLPNHTFTGQA